MYRFASRKGKREETKVKFELAGSTMWGRARKVRSYFSFTRNIWLSMFPVLWFFFGASFSYDSAQRSNDMNKEYAVPNSIILCFIHAVTLCLLLDFDIWIVDGKITRGESVLVSFFILIYVYSYLSVVASENVANICVYCYRNKEHCSQFSPSKFIVSQKGAMLQDELVCVSNPRAGSLLPESRDGMSVLIWHCVRLLVRRRDLVISPSLLGVLQGNQRGARATACMHNSQRWSS